MKTRDFPAKSPRCRNYSARFAARPARSGDARRRHQRADLDPRLSLFSARLAVSLGTPSPLRFAPRQVLQAIELYRSQFQAPGPAGRTLRGDQRPLIAAPTDDEAEYLASSNYQRVLGIPTGNRRRLQPRSRIPMLASLVPEERAAIGSRLPGGGHRRPRERVHDGSVPASPSSRGRRVRCWSATSSTRTCACVRWIYRARRDARLTLSTLRRGSPPAGPHRPRARPFPRFHHGFRQTLPRLIGRSALLVVGLHAVPAGCLRPGPRRGPQARRAAPPGVPLRQLRQWQRRRLRRGADAALRQRARAYYEFVQTNWNDVIGDPPCKEIRCNRASRRSARGRSAAT